MRDLVELFVTKKIFFPALRSISSTAGTPSISESPFQITPSQSKMKTSTESSRSPGTSSFLQSPAAFIEMACSPPRSVCIPAAERTAGDHDLAASAGERAGPRSMAEPTVYADAYAQKKARFMAERSIVQ